MSHLISKGRVRNKSRSSEDLLSVIRAYRVAEVIYSSTISSFKG